MWRGPRLERASLAAGCARARSTARIESARGPHCQPGATRGFVGSLLAGCVSPAAFKFVESPVSWLTPHPRSSCSQTAKTITPTKNCPLD